MGKWKQLPAVPFFCVAVIPWILRALDWLSRGETLINLYASLPDWLHFLEPPVASLLCFILGFAWLAYLTRKKQPTPTDLFDHKGNVFKAASIDFRTLLRPAVIGIAAGVIIAIAIFFWNPFPRRGLVYPYFQTIYDKYSDKLLRALEKESSADIIHQVRFENAWAVFLRNQSGWYVMFDDGTWQYQRDDRPDPEGIPNQWGNRWWLERQDWMGDGSSPPKRKSVPNGGVAKLWCQKPTLWRRVGWVDWECHYVTKTVWSQEFERGIIIGGLRSWYGYNDSRVFVLYGLGAPSRTR